MVGLVQLENKNIKMNLSESLLKICKAEEITEPMHPGFDTNTLSDLQKTEIEDALIEHMGVKSVKWMTLPTELLEEGKPIIAQSLIMKPDSDFSPEATDNKYKDKTAYIYKIAFTPKMYNPAELYEPVKDGCVISPVLYNPTTFVPKRSITLTWNPETLQDDRDPINPMTWEEEKKYFHDKLESVLETPDDYLPKGYIGCLLRAAFIEE